MKELQSLNKFLWKYRWQLTAGFVMVVLSNLVSVYSITFVGSAVNEIKNVLTQYSSGDIGNLDKVKKKSVICRTLVHRIENYCGDILGRR